jgi:hypothetical protein
VLVQANDDADFLMVAGSVAFGKTAGIGAAATVLIHDDTVEAYIDQDAIVDAAGKSTLTALTGQKDSSGNSLTQTVQGLAVVATSNEDVLTVAAGAAGGKTVGLQGSAVVMVLDENTNAHINNGAQINMKTPVSTEAVDVLVLASDNTDILSVAGAIGISKTAGIGAAGDIAIITKNTGAWIDSNTDVKATGSVSLLASSNEDVIAVAGSIGAGMTVGFAASGAVYLMDTTTEAYVADGAVAGQGAVLDANGNITVAAEGHADLLMVAGTLGLGKTGGVGIAASVLDREDTVEAYVGNYAVITARGLNDTTSAYLCDLNANGQAPRADAKGVFVWATSSEELVTIAAAGALASTIGFAASGVVNVIEETTLAHINQGATVNAISGDVTATDYTDGFGLGGSLAGA